MAAVIRLTWRGITAAQYDEARERVGWERDVPPGGVCHLAWFTPEGLHIVNVWDSAEKFERFVQGRLMPVVKGELGFAGEPEVSVHEAHAVFIIPHPRQ